MTPAAERKYLSLLLAVVGLVALYPVLLAAPDSRVLLSVLVTVVFLTSFRVVARDRAFRHAALLLGVPTLAGLWVGLLLPGSQRTAVGLAFHVFGASFYAVMIGAILRDVYRSPGVTPDSVYGAFCGYVLTGVVFGHVYSVIETLHPGSFRGDALAEVMSDNRRHFLLTYYSLVTLATVGYGDVVPGSDPARGLAVVEAITGQFYIAVLVAELIGKRVGQPPADASPPPRA